MFSMLSICHSFSFHWIFHTFWSFIKKNQKSDNTLHIFVVLPTKCLWNKADCIPVQTNYIPEVCPLSLPLPPPLSRSLSLSLSLPTLPWAFTHSPAHTSPSPLIVLRFPLPTLFLQQTWPLNRMEQPCVRALLGVCLALSRARLLCTLAPRSASRCWTAAGCCAPSWSSSPTEPPTCGWQRTTTWGRTIGGSGSR